MSLWGLGQRPEYKKFFLVIWENPRMLYRFTFRFALERWNYKDSLLKNLHLLANGKNPYFLFL